MAEAWQANVVSHISPAYQIISPCNKKKMKNLRVWYVCTSDPEWAHEEHSSAIKGRSKMKISRGVNQPPVGGQLRCNVSQAQQLNHITSHS